MGGACSSKKKNAAKAEEPAKTPPATPTPPPAAPEPAAPEAPAAAAAPPASAQSLAAPASSASLASAPPAPSRGPMGNANITCDGVATVLKNMGAAKEQMMFFESWAELIGKKALMISGNKAVLQVMTNMDALEFRIRAEASAMIQLAADFIAQCGVPPGQLEEMQMAQKEVNAQEVTLWCKCKHITGSAASIDAGYVLNGPLDWMLSDVLMPSTDDHDALRDYAVQEHVKPVNFGSSFFPSEPEKRLSFEMADENTRKSIISAFFFFKSLGFAKPEDIVVKLLSKSQPVGFMINVSMGPRGLTGLRVTLNQPVRMIAKDLADAVLFRYDENAVSQLVDAMGGAPIDVVGYAAESSGYVVTVGFSSGGMGAGSYQFVD